MKIKIIEQSEDKCNNYFIDMPLRYRIKLYLYDEIILVREYFRVGFLCGEENDEFYIDSEINKWDIKPSTRFISFMTQNLDKEYHKKKEKQLLNIAYEKILKSKKNLKIDLKKEINKFEKEIDKYNQFLEYPEFKKISRIKKIEELNYKKT